MAVGEIKKEKADGELRHQVAQCRLYPEKHRTIALARILPHVKQLEDGFVSEHC